MAARDVCTKFFGYDTIPFMAANHTDKSSMIDITISISSTFFKKANITLLTVTASAFPLVSFTGHIKPSTIKSETWLFVRDFICPDNECDNLRYWNSPGELAEPGNFFNKYDSMVMPKASSSSEIHLNLFFNSPRTCCRILLPTWIITKIIGLLKMEKQKLCHITIL